MTLTSQQRSGELGDWMAVRFAGAHELAQQVQRGCGHSQRPVMPNSGHPRDGHPWAAIGGAFGQRLAFFVEHAPPYYGLAGTVAMDLAPWPEVHAATARFPSHRRLPLGNRPRAWDWRPTARGWADTAPPHPGAPGCYPEQGASTDEFMSRLVDYLARHSPPGALAGTPGAEAQLMRVCWVLTAWEDAYRCGRLDVGYMTADVGELLALAPEHIVTELVALSARAHSAGALEQFRRLGGSPAPGQPLGIAGPVFVPHWADGDLLIGDTLVDVKTVASARNIHRTTQWLHQLLAYAWLDRHDRYAIRRVGLYLARHGVLLTWPLDDFAATLAGTTDPVRLGSIRAEFDRVTARVICSEGGDPSFAFASAAVPAPRSTGPVGDGPAINSTVGRT